MQTTIATTKKYVSRRLDLEYIEADIRARIAGGHWSPGTMIPSRRDLAREYCVDLNVIQRALSSLIEERTLVAGVGRGTFVADIDPSRILAAIANPSVEPPAEYLAPLASQINATVGIVGSLWAYNESTREPHDNWPAALLHAFEWGMAGMPHVTIKFNESKRGHHESHADAYHRCVSELVAAGADGLALIMPPSEVLDEVEALTSVRAIPTVIIHDGSSASPTLPHVFYDSGYAGFQAAKHLVQRGYENISFFCPFTDDWWTLSRREGVESALRRAGKSLYSTSDDIENKPKAMSEDQRGAAREPASAFLADRPPSWGIVAVNDHAAHGLIDAAAQIGLSPGRDFGLIGFDDLSESRMLDMTSVHPPLDAMGAEAARILSNYLSGMRTTTEVRLRSHLVSRLSTQHA